MIKSYGFWTALAGALVVLVNALGKCFGFAVEDDIVYGLVMAVAGVLVVFGVVSMPPSENKDKTEEQSLDQEKQHQDKQEQENQEIEPQAKQEKQSSRLEDK